MPRAIRGRVARYDFIGLLDGGRVEDALVRAREEIGNDAIWEALEVEVRARAIDGGRLDEVLSGRAGMTLSRRPAHELWEIDRCQFYLVMAGVAADPPALDLLQAALHLLVVLANEGDLLLALDGATARWLSPESLLALDAERGFDLDEHVDVVVEAVERKAGVGHVVRARGMVKFARPDVCARVPRKEAERVSEIVRDIARLLAEGETLLPGDRVNAPGLPPLTLIPRSDDALWDADAETAPLYELRDLSPEGGPEGSPRAGLQGLLETLARARRPKLRVLKP